ncbi:hypothetical protein BDN70DRAFT_814299 [Pholiota conissans]|uniref:PhoD-like phosphatase metallophosphatase domain-containing protein n=1 Tax=Pholiota conissans TaxID=109636 RepID=A0A9P6CW39_9AGAR|nr:hypothetical protein BDN70DRAFT_814299 [Pholiota conissans]
MFSALFSSLFRAAAFIFLRIIPSRLLRVPIPALFAAYVLAAWLARPPPPVQDKRHKRPPRRPPPRPRVLPTVLFSLPTHSRALTLANAAINVLLLLAVLDFAGTPFLDTAQHVVFTRVGAVYPDSIKLVVRYPHQHSLLVLYRESTADPNATWTHGPLLTLTPDADWVATARITHLWPSTSYQYRLADPNATLLPYPPNPISFRTFPDPRLPTTTRFRFIASSCTVPNFPYRGPLHKRSIKGYDLLADYLLQNPHPPNHTDPSLPILNPTTNDDLVPTEFLLFLGDFIYADVPFYGGDDKEAYRRLYRRNYQSTSYRRIYEQLPIFHAYDDHEFIDNYAGQSEDLAPFANANNAYSIYAGDANYDPALPTQSFYDFTHGDVAFFVMDTRRYRSGANTTATERTMLGPEQLTALHTWLSKVNSTTTFKFIVSSVPFTTLFTHDAQIDTWAFYREEQASVLALLQSVPNVVVISGDRHQFAAIEFPAPHKAHAVLEVSTSPLSMFYIPIISAIQDRSEEFFVRNVSIPNLEGEMVQHVQKIPRERVLKYIPKGNYKWSAFEIDTRDPARPTLRIETVIDGKPAYHLEVVGTPSKMHHGLGALVTHGVADWFSRLGLAPAKWF